MSVPVPISIPSTSRARRDHRACVRGAALSGPQAPGQWRAALRDSAPTCGCELERFLHLLLLACQCRCAVAAR
jgi:hypothetical protein